MLDLLIPKAFAQGAVGTVANNAAGAAVEKSQAGFQAFVGYVLSNLDNWLAGLVVVVIFYILGKMAGAAVRSAIIKEKEDVQESALILIERITKITVLAIGITIALAINGLNFTAVIGALSLGVGFALKDIIGNFISGVVMLSQNNIKIGDLINVNGIIGTIVSIDTRATILQALDGSEVVIPNSIMLGQTLISYTTNPFRRIDLAVGVDYKADLSMVISLIKGVLDKDKDVVVKPEPLITVDEFGESSIGIMVRFWVESRAAGGWQRIRSNVAYRLKCAFDEVGINIPFPIRTLKLDEDDRAILKTMDSLKKGFVPEPSKIPTTEQIAQAAVHTENIAKHPYKIFPEAPKPAAPAPIPVPVAVPVTPPAPPKAPTPPPTHL